jgi:hypothetical protein
MTYTVEHVLLLKTFSTMLVVYQDRRFFVERSSKYVVKSKNYECPFYAIFSTLTLFFSFRFSYCSEHTVVKHPQCMFFPC